jgi:hypothetical protein
LKWNPGQYYLLFSLWNFPSIWLGKKPNSFLVVGCLQFILSYLFNIHFLLAKENEFYAFYGWFHVSILVINANTKLILLTPDLFRNSNPFGFCWDSTTSSEPFHEKGSHRNQRYSWFY